ncbi:excisionase family DNA binding protein [Lacibacter cauensis]|uniref:Excisionase family DNA binding protein n=1 Tax=Lacibacter cauensis TaxID=510947 RepID=A0A562SWT3_9BACT|nr:helix-turn-helix domain-containing protein [Lacibacter cauensis]TWI85757.1 excisionase family DNA binding protein [Lacibacter cauensis]
MKEQVKNGTIITPMLFPYDPEQYWQQVRQIIREEVSNLETQKEKSISYETPGLTYKPLYKIAEVCSLFQITKPTIYEWIKHGKLKPHKIRSRVYFLWQDIQQLLLKQI